MEKISQELLSTFQVPDAPGIFISFEGIEGAGKSTQVSHLMKYLYEQKRFRVLKYREPGGTLLNEKLRLAILETKTEIIPLAEAHLFAASRAQLMSEVILKELAVKNTIVICDRFIDSSIVYQGHARGLGIAEVLEIHNIYPLNLVPHLTFYLRIEAETSEERQKLRGAKKDYFEARGLDFYQKLVDGYDLLHELFPKRIVKIDSSFSVDDVTQNILSTVNIFLEEKLK